MCLIAFAIEAAPGCALLIASNRDEAIDRPTAPLHRWTLPNGMDVIGGRDLRDGGTWLGINTAGRVAMLTNVREAQPSPAARSRGELATRWLAGDISEAQLQASLAPADYGGFNMVVGDVVSGAWAWLSNRDPAQPHRSGRSALHHRALAPGVYGLSNATLDTGWPKTLRLKRAMAEALAVDPTANSQAWRDGLLAALGDGDLAEALPDTGVPLAMERALSSPFVHMPERGYGTRSSLLLRATREGQGGCVELEEWSHGADHGGVPRWGDDQRVSATLRW